MDLCLAIFPLPKSLAFSLSLFLVFFSRICGMDTNYALSLSISLSLAIPSLYFNFGKVFLVRGNSWEEQLSLSQAGLLSLFGQNPGTATNTCEFTSSFTVQRADLAFVRPSERIHFREGTMQNLQSFIEEHLASPRDAAARNTYFRG